MLRIHSRLLGAATIAIVASSPAALAQKLAPASPCCTIVSIDAGTGTVTAKTISTGKTFRFKIGHAGPVDGFTAKTGIGPVDGFQPVDGFSIKNRVGPIDGVGPVDGIGPVDAGKFLATLKVGQKIWANLAGQVSINNAEPCCGILVTGNTP
jgi:hypothetical protein